MAKLTQIVKRVLSEVPWGWLGTNMAAGIGPTTGESVTQDSPTRVESLAGFPFGAITPFACDATGDVIVLISGLAVHTRNLRADPRGSLTVSAAIGGEAGNSNDPLTAPRVCLLGAFDEVSSAEDRVSVRDHYLSRQPQAAAWAEFSDFAWYRLRVQAGYVVAGFGAMGWLDISEYRREMSAGL